MIFNAAAYFLDAPFYNFCSFSLVQRNRQQMQQLWKLLRETSLPFHQTISASRFIAA